MFMFPILCAGLKKHTQKKKKMEVKCYREVSDTLARRLEPPREAPFPVAVKGSRSGLSALSVSGRFKVEEFPLQCDCGCGCCRSGRRSLFPQGRSDVAIYTSPTLSEV